MAVFADLDDKTLASLTKRTKLFESGQVTVIDKKTTVVMSNTLTGIQNAFNKILTYSKNMNKIQEAKLEDTGLYSKEAQLEAPKATRVAQAAPVSDSALVDLIPDLLKVVKKLNKELEGLDLSSGGLGGNGIDVGDIDIERERPRRRGKGRKGTSKARMAGRAAGIASVGLDVYDRSSEGQSAGQIGLGVGGGLVGAEAGAAAGASIGALFGPADIVTVPLGGLIGGALGYMGGSAVGDKVYEVASTPSTKENPAQQRAQRDSAKQNDKLVKAATKAASVQAVPVKKPEPTKAMSNQGNEWTGKVSAFIGSTYRNVTSFMDGFLGKLASLGGQLGDLLSGGAQNLAGLFGFGGGPGFSQVVTKGINAEWAKDSNFITGINQLAQKWDIDAGDLLGLMNSESGINPQARNASGGATGLIQFMPSTAKALGTSTDAIFKLNRAQQLPLVDKFFEMSKLPKGATAGQLYATVFLPAYNRKADNFVVARANGPNDAGQVKPKWYTQNAGLDVNRDGAITISDLGMRVSNKRAELGLGASKAGSGFRALGNLASGAMSGLSGLVGDVGTFVGDVGSYVGGSIFGTATKFLGLNAAQGGAALNQFVGRYFQQGFNVKSTPWCAAFANSVLGSQGIKGTGSPAAISFRTFGGLVWDRQAGGNLRAAAKGDIAVFRRPRGTGHVAFVDSINLQAGTITYVGGNQGDRSVGGVVSKSTIKIDNPTYGLIAVRRASGGSPVRPETQPASSMPQTAASLAIDKKKPPVRSTSTSRGTPGRVVPAGGPGRRPKQPQKKSAMDQFLGYFGAA